MGVIHLKHVTISTYFYRTQMQKHIERRLQEISPNEYRPTCEIINQDKVWLITYSFPKQVSFQKQKLLFKDYIIIPIAKAIGDLIDDHFSPQYASDIISGDDRLIMEDKTKITLLFNKIWQNVIGNKDDTGKYVRIDDQVAPIIEELVNKRAIMIEGWIQFRLSNYKQHIKDIVKRIIFEYMAYMEYKEFLALLKQFIEVQESIVDVIQIIPDLNGEIHLYDKNNKEITRKCIEQYAEPIDSPDNSIEDEILSVLLAIAPLQIIIHKKERCNNKQFINTIQKIYEDKVVICQNCKYCNKVIDIS